MTYKEKFNSSTLWFQKAAVMNLYHITMKSKSSKHTISDTAKYFSRSSGYVSETLALIANQVKVEKFPTRREALFLLKGKI